MRKKILYVIILVLLAGSGCTMFKSLLDKKMDFSSELAAVESFINDDNWENAEESLTQCMEKWVKIKPWMQLELDHDVINEIEKKLTELSAYLETKEKSSALANIRVVINYWEDIGSK